jgi:hypothetical protein
MAWQVVNIEAGSAGRGVTGAGHDSVVVTQPGFEEELFLPARVSCSRQ